MSQCPLGFGFELPAFDTLYMVWAQISYVPRWPVGPLDVLYRLCVAVAEAGSGILHCVPGSSRGFLSRARNTLESI